MSRQEGRQPANDRAESGEGQWRKGNAVMRVGRGGAGKGDSSEMVAKDEKSDGAEERRGDCGTRIRLTGGVRGRKERYDGGVLKGSVRGEVESACAGGGEKDAVGSDWKGVGVRFGARIG